MKDYFDLYCSDRSSGRGEWRFQEHEGGMEVLDPDDRVVCWFPHKEANDRFDLPSFWRSVKNITFTTDRGVVVRFKPDRKDVATVREYLDDALLAQGRESLDRLRNLGLLGTLGGLALVAVSLAVVFLISQGSDAADLQAHRFRRPFFFGAIGGLAFFGFGVAALLRWSRLSRRYNEERERPARRRGR